MPIQFPNASMLAQPPRLESPLSYAEQQKNALGDIVLQKEQQGMETANAMKQIFSQPGALGQDGIPTPQTLNALYAINPEVGARVGTLAEASRHRKVQEQEWIAQAQERKQKLFMDNAAKVLTFYERAVQTTGDDAKARQQTDAYVGQLHDEMLKSDSTLGPRPGPFDPDQWYPKVQNAQMLAAEKAEQRKAEAERKSRAGTLSQPIPVDDKLVTFVRQPDGTMKPMFSAPNPALIRAEKETVAPVGQLVQDDAGNYVRVQGTSVSPVTGADGKPLKGKQDMPASLIKDMAQNNVTLTKIDRALDLADKHPDAFGLKNYLPDAAIQRYDEDGVDARSVVSDLAGQKIHDRSGAAVTVQEAARLRPYIPNNTDSTEVVKKKLRSLRREYTQMQEELALGKSIISVTERRAGATGDFSAPKDGWKIEVVK